MHPPCTYTCPEYEQLATVSCRARRQQLLQQGWNFYSIEAPLVPSSSSYDAQQRRDPADAQPCSREMVTVLVGCARSSAVGGGANLSQERVFSARFWPAKQRETKPSKHADVVGSETCAGCYAHWGLLPQVLRDPVKHVQSHIYELKQTFARWGAGSATVHRHGQRQGFAGIGIFPAQRSVVARALSGPERGRERRFG